MRKIIFLAGILSFISSSVVLAESKNIQCTGEAEYGEYVISRLVITPKAVVLTYTTDKANPAKTIVKNYKVTEYMESNGSTDSPFRKAYFIGATQSGYKKDHEDIALPHYGVYKTGLGSEVAFNHGNRRVFGSVSCKEF